MAKEKTFSCATKAGNTARVASRDQNQHNLLHRCQLADSIVK